MSGGTYEKLKRSQLGPHGLGDPEDKTLRKMEMNILLPQFRRDIVKNEKCPKEIDVYQNCVLEHGLMGAYIKCRKERVALNDCLEYWNDDDEIIARAKKEYLEARSKYRRTGISEDYRIKINTYIDEQEALQKESSQPS